MAIVSSWCETVLLSQATSETHALSYKFLLRGRCTLSGLPVLNGRKEWATVGQYGPKHLGYTRHTVDGTMGCDSERRSQSSKSIRGSDRGLQLTLVKMECLVIACHYHAVNASPLLAHTARQVTQMFFR